MLQLITLLWQEWWLQLWLTRGLTSARHTHAKHNHKSSEPENLFPHYSHPPTHFVWASQISTVTRKILKTSRRASSPASTTTFEFPSRTGLWSVKQCNSCTYTPFRLHRSLFWFSIFHTSAASRCHDPFCAFNRVDLLESHFYLRCFHTTIIAPYIRLTWHTGGRWKGNYSANF